MDDDSLRIELGDGLLLRRATVNDMDAVVAFNTLIHANDGVPSVVTGASTSDLFGRRHPHPTMTPADVTIVEDPSSGAIVSSLCLIPQTWSYGGISFPATLVENVGTHTDYRNRGLARRQMEVVHGWCAERGILVQGIAGIPWYYRQFGYEYALPVGPGRVARRATTPKLAGEEPVSLRTATVDDARFIAELEDVARGRWLTTSVRDEQIWRYEIDGRDPASDASGRVHVIERPDGIRVGYVNYVLPPEDESWIVAFEVAPDVSWLEVVPAVLRHVMAAADARGEAENRETYALLELGQDHPSYRAMPGVLAIPTKPYACYIRVPDLPAFLTRIAPVLERRLAESLAHGYSGELPINFYRGGVRLVFTEGTLASVITERMNADVAASLPDLTFLQLLFGYRSLTELDAWYPDCVIRTNEARVLLDVLFPKQPSYIWPIW